VRALSRTLLALTFTAALAGCDPGTGVSASGFCDMWLNAWCMKQAECCTDSLGRYSSVATCVAAQRPSCSLGLGVAFQSSTPTAFFDSARATSALSDLRAADCSAALPSLDAISPPIVRGTLAAGADCSPIGGDLSPTLSCGPSYRCLLGATRTGALRGQCVNEGASVGASCASQTCVSGMYCQLSATGSTGSCQMKLGPGAPCTADVACAEGTCDLSTSTGTSACSFAFAGTGSAWCVPGAGSVTVPPMDAGTE